MRVRTMLAAAAALLILSGSTAAEARDRGGAFFGIHASAGGKPASSHRGGTPKAHHDVTPVRASATSEIARAGAAVGPAAIGGNARLAVAERAEANLRVWCPSGRVIGRGMGFCDVSSAL